MPDCFSIEHGESPEEFVERVKERLTGNPLADIAMLDRIANSIPAERIQMRSKIFMMLLQAGKYAFITENNRVPQQDYKTYVLRNVDADLACIKMDVYQCFTLIQAFSTEGDIEALLELGRGFYGGSLKEIDWPFAALCFELAAESGSKDAQFMIAYLYLEGHGVPQDKAKAAGWYKTIAEQGDPEAQFQFGLMCECGIGVTEDQKEAAHWYEKAALLGHEAAADWVNQHRK